MIKLLTEIKETYKKFNEESVKNAEGNKAAGVRARKAAMQLINSLKEFRKESMDKDRKDGNND